MKATSNPSERAFGGSLRRLVRWLMPDLTMTRPESLAAIANLQRRLNEERRETAKWRERCLKVEDLCAAQIRRMQEEAKEHPGLSWRCW